MASSRRPLTDEQREEMTRAQMQIKTAGYQDALRRRQEMEQQVYAEQQQKTSSGRSGPAIVYKGGSKGSPEQTANYQKHTLIALTTAFLITMFSNKIAGTVGKAKGG